MVIQSWTISRISWNKFITMYQNYFCFRSPPELAQEIILVDDGAEQDHLKDQLNQYITIFKLLYCRSPPELVEEIILVDDSSELDHLRDQLDQYITIDQNYFCSDPHQS
jgi:hypothetical protein